MNRSIAARLGYWAALSLFFETVPFFVAEVAALFSVNADMLAFFVCAFLPVSFITMIASLHSLVPPEKRLYTRLALAFASVYAAFCTTVYFLQLCVVRTNPLGLSTDVVRLIKMEPGAAGFAVDMLGYGFMCLAAAALVPTVTGTTVRDRWLRGLLIVKAVMGVPTIIFPALVGPATVGGDASTSTYGALALAVWCVLFMPIAALFAARFRAMDKELS